MTSVSSIRAEIKLWEREFRIKNARDPTIQDIKDRPQIADKYKLYKKLSKAVPASNSQSTSLPSTPPRPDTRGTRSASVIPHQRSVEVSAPLTGANPFSPTKNKGKHREIFSNFRSDDLSSDPYTTPKKCVSKPRFDSSNSLPQIQPLDLPGPSGNLVRPQAPSSALSRARRRLRGESVSPSPSKQKRYRDRDAIDGSPPFPVLNILSRARSDEEDEADGFTAAGPSLFDDSPVKAPAGRKSFKLLFDEDVPSSKPSSSLPFREPKIPALFAEKRDSAKAVSFSGNEPLLKSRSNSKVKLDRLKSGANSKPFLPKSSKSPSADTFLADNRERPLSETSQDANSMLPRTTVDSRSSGKRSLPETEMDIETIGSQPLLPPSPTGDDPPDRDLYSQKGKEKSKGPSRKKVKLGDGPKDEGDEESSGEDPPPVKLIDRTKRLVTTHAHNDEGDTILGELDPVFTFGRSRGPAHGQDTPNSHNFTPMALGDEQDKNDDGEIEVSLPDTLRRVLAISPSRNRDHKEDEVLRGLLYGTRLSRYDAAIGGEVWDAGEAENEDVGEGDWEEEPIPWEIGEL